MKKLFWTITFVLFFAVSLCACRNDEFPTGSYIHNEYVIEYRDDGTFTLWKNGEIETEGTYSVKGDELTWIQDSVCDAENAGSATYQWLADDDGLRLELIGEDRCEGRRAVCSVKFYGSN